VQFNTVTAPAEANRDGKDRGSPLTPARAVRILLVEDDPSTLDVMHRLLASMRHETVQANSVASALEAARRHPVDLVISDLGLPDGLGYDLMREISDQYGIRGIALSGYGMPADIQQSRDAGFAEHLTKPVDLQALEAAIARVISAEVDR
jgi:CheY-like chemotaxis protein